MLLWLYMLAEGLHLLFTGHMIGKFESAEIDIRRETIFAGIGLTILALAFIRLSWDGLFIQKFLRRRKKTGSEPVSSACLL